MCHSCVVRDCVTYDGRTTCRAWSACVIFLAISDVLIPIGGDFDVNLSIDVIKTYHSLKYTSSETLNGKCPKRSIGRNLLQLLKKYKIFKIELIFRQF